MKLDTSDAGKTPIEKARPVRHSEKGTTRSTKSVETLVFACERASVHVARNGEEAKRLSCRVARAQGGCQQSRRLGGAIDSSTTIDMRLACVSMTWRVRKLQRRNVQRGLNAGRRERIPGSVRLGPGWG